MKVAAMLDSDVRAGDVSLAFPCCNIVVIGDAFEINE